MEGREYGSINYVYTAANMSVIVGYTSSWSYGQIPGITISAYGNSISGSNLYINKIDNGDGTYSYHFLLSGTPTTKGSFLVRNSHLPPQINNGMWFEFIIVDEHSSSPQYAQTHNPKMMSNLSTTFRFEELRLVFVDIHLPLQFHACRLEVFPDVPAWLIGRQDAVVVYAADQ